MTTSKSSPGGNVGAYALVTAAYNEERYIQRALDSVTTQTVLPQKWIVVSDGSTDRTDEIVRSYAGRWDFIELHRISEAHPKNFTAQVRAINSGFARLTGTDVDFIGNLDADISLETTYFARLLEKFVHDPKLGLAGGYIYEERNGEFRCRPNNSIPSVAHGVQLFRRECLLRLGGYKPFSWGGTDHHAEVSIRMHGWRANSFAELKAFHHRPTGQSFGGLRYSYRGGLADFYIGYHPLFEFFKLARRFPSSPLHVLVRLVGFIWAYCRRHDRQVSHEFLDFLRSEQLQRLGSLGKLLSRASRRGFLRRPSNAREEI